MIFCLAATTNGRTQWGKVQEKPVRLEVREAVKNVLADFAL